MANLKKKLKLNAILKKLGGDASKNDHFIVEEIANEIEKIKSTPSPYMGEVEVLKKQQDLIFKSLKDVTEDNVKKERLIFDLMDIITKEKKKTSTIEKEIERYNVEILGLRQRTGGGSAHARMSIGGTVISNRYADFNFIAGSNMTIAAVNNNTTKQIDITFSSSGGGSTPVLAVENPSGTINGSNVTFGVTNTPLWMVLNGETLYENDGYTLSGTTVTMNVIPLTGSTLRSVYQTGTVVAVETPSGTINGSNPTFTVANTPLWLTINGVSYFENNGYTLSGLSVTIDSTIIPITGSTLRSVYKAGTVVVNSEVPSGAINSSNVTYTVTSTPLWVLLNGQTLFANDGYTMSSLTMTMSIVPLTNSLLRSIY